MVVNIAASVENPKITWMNTVRCDENDPIHGEVDLQGFFESVSWVLSTQGNRLTISSREYFHG